MTGYDYTKPRKPIAAMYNSPGPCYPLPTTTGQPGHDPQSKYVKRPGWFFGVKHGSLTQDSSPGPVHLPPQKYSRYGPDGEPHWSLYSRPADLKTDKPPGPGAYSPEHSGPSASFHAPAYGFGNRSKLRTQDNVPAPNRYSLPVLLGPKTIEAGKTQAPSWSQRGRNTRGGFDEDLGKTPGPGTYVSTNPDTVKRKAPVYSMLSRNEMPGDGTRKPGPGAHKPENVVVHKPKNPNFSFGIRHSEYLCPLIVDAQD